MKLEQTDEGFCIDAALLGELLDVQPLAVQALMRSNEITSVCERGEGEHAGQHRLTFFYKSRRVRLNVDESGHILRRSVIDFGEHPLPPAMRRFETRSGSSSSERDASVGEAHSLTAPVIDET